MDYGDKLPPRPWCNFTPPHRYIFAPPLTEGPERAVEGGANHVLAYVLLVFRAQMPEAKSEHRSEKQLIGVDMFRVAGLEKTAVNPSPDRMYGLDEDLHAFGRNRRGICGLRPGMLFP